jgi:hypothetical protein
MVTKAVSGLKKLPTNVNRTQKLVLAALAGAIHRKF